LMAGKASEAVADVFIKVRRVGGVMREG